MRTKKLALTGYYGMNNYGDDLFAICSYSAALKYWPSFDPIILSPSLTNFQANYGFPSLLSDKIWQLHSPAGQIARACTLVSNSMRVEKYVFAGGSVFTSSTVGVNDLVLSLTAYKAISLSAIGVSIGPFKRSCDEKKVKERLKRFDYIAVRDQISYQRLESYGLDAKILESADLAGVLPLILPVSAENDTHNDDSLLIGFSPCCMPERPDLEKLYCDIFVQAVTQLPAHRRVSVNVICLNQHYKVGDVDLCIYVKDALDRHGVANSLTFYNDIGALNTWSMISRLDAYISVRLHGAITAYLCNVPFFLFEYHEKCSSFLDFIGKFDNERHFGQDITYEIFNECFQNILNTKTACNLDTESFCKISELNFLGSPLHHE